MITLFGTLKKKTRISQLLNSVTGCINIEKWDEHTVHTYA